MERRTSNLEFAGIIMGRTEDDVFFDFVNSCLAVNSDYIRTHYGATYALRFPPLGLNSAKLYDERSNCIELAASMLDSNHLRILVRRIWAQHRDRHRGLPASVVCIADEMYRA